MKYICTANKFEINGNLIATKRNLLEVYDARPEEGETAEDVAGYCDIFNITTGAIFEATWNDIDNNVLQEVKEPIIGYYECEFETDPKCGTESICIKGERIPTVEEANAFLAEDIKAWYHAHVVKVIPLTEHEARDCFNFENEADWPVFR